MSYQLTLKLDPNYANGLTTYEDFVVAAAKLTGDIYRVTSLEMDYSEREYLVSSLSSATNEDYTGMWYLSCLPRHDLFCLVLRALVRATRDYNNNHRATAPAGYVSRFLSGRITRDESLTLHEKISYRGRVSGRAYARRQSPCPNLSFD